MAESAELLKRPLYAYDLPPTLLSTLKLKTTTTPLHFSPSNDISVAPDTPTDIPDTDSYSKDDSMRQATSCALCSIAFPTVVDQRHHARSDWHGYNLKQKLRSQPPVTEPEFERLVDDLDESISGSDSSSEEEEEGTGSGTQLATLLKKQARLAQDRDLESEEGVMLPGKRKKRGAGAAPLVWFSSTALADNVSLGVYKALFTDSELQSANLLETLRSKQLKPAKVQTSTAGSEPQADVGPNVFMCMIGGGHFAGMVVSLAPKVGKKANGIEDRQAIVVAHKTFHRYTTRRKQGGAQSSNDAAKGAAHSAGAGIRRHNEIALEAEVRALLGQWKSLIDRCQLLFVRATGTANRRTLFGPYDGQVLRQKDLRNRTFPFSTRRATQGELMRAFVEITRVKVSEVDEAALAAIAAEEAKKGELQSKSAAVPPKASVPKPSKEEEAALLHTSQLQALIRRSKVPAVLSYLTSNTLSPDFVFQPLSTQANHHASTPLHMAASSNSPIMVLSLLTKAGSNPGFLNGEGKVAFDLAGDRQTRNAFRVARFELGEGRWNWEEAGCPSAMTKAEADKREDDDKVEARKAEAERRRAETERLEQEAQAKPGLKSKGPGKSLGVTETTAADRREQESRGLTPEMISRLERERRARAAEERIKRMTGR